jgi:predicted nucleotidyltransferase
MVSDELKTLAETVARWVDDVPGISRVYLFGSRVRGDHRSDSDVDLRLFVDDMGNDNETTIWWDRQNESEFAELKGHLPGPLGLHRDPEDFDGDIKRGNPVLIRRKVWCIATPPKPGYGARAS